MQRVGGSLSLQQSVSDLQQRVTRLENYAASLPASWAANFTVAPSPTLGGAQVSFQLVNAAGIAQIQLLRSFTLDPRSASVLQAYAAQSLAPGGTFTYSDLDPALAGKQANYWLAALPLNGALATAYLGPQTLQAAAADQVPPDALLAFDASISAGPDGETVTVGVAFQPPNESRFGSCRIYVSGYKGNPAAVAVGQFTSDPDNFVLQKTGEAVTLSGVSVNKAGIAAVIGTALTRVVTLGAPTAPCKILQGTATATPTGVQINWPAGPEASITSYRVLRGPLGGGFGAAAQIAAVAPTSAAAYSYLDADGLTGQFEWYVQAVNPAGTSAAPPAITTQAVTSSANLPANVPYNTTNFATLDSIDAGSSATVQIFGAGGVGTSWTRGTGYGTETFPAGTIAGLAYSTGYYVLWNGSGYFATTEFPSALADNDIWAGTVVTVAAGGGGGTSGGGGDDGSGSDGRLHPLV